MILKIVCAALGLIAVSSSPLFAQAVSTPVVGFQKITMPQGGIAVGPTFVKEAVFSGNVTISGSTATLATGSLPGNLGPTTYSDRANYPRYYAEVTSSTSEYYGHNFDITSNTSGSFTSNNMPVGLTGAVSVVIRRHFTLADMGAASFNDGDSVNFVNDPSGDQATFYAVGGEWYNADFNPGYSHKPIYPGEAVIFSGQSGQVTVTLTGLVKTTPTAVPLYVSSYANLIVAPNPSATVLLANQNLQNYLNDGAAFTIYSSDGAFVEDSTYYTITGGIYDSDFAPTSSTIPVQGGTGINIGSLDSDQVILLPGVQVN